MRNKLIDTLLAEQDECWRRAEAGILDRLQQFHIAQPRGRFEYDCECRLLRGAMEQLIQAKLSQMAAFEYRVKEALLASPTRVILNDDEYPTPNGFGG